MFRKIRNILFFCGIIPLYLCNGHSYAQTVHFDADYYTSLQGLSQHYIYAILQDHKGFMWFGTKDGLNRFDGYTFKIYRNNPNDSTSLSDNYIISLYEDKDSNLWIGTASGGLNKFNRNAETFVRYPNTTRDEVTRSYFNINALYHDDGKIWIGTNGHGLHIYDPATGKIQRVLSQTREGIYSPVMRVYKIYKDLEGRVWVATVESGLILAENVNGKLRFKSFIPENTKPGLEGIHINTIVQPKLSNGKILWVGTNRGLFKFDPASGNFNKVILKNIDQNLLVWQIEETNDGGLWISYYDKFIKFYPSTSKYYIMTNQQRPEINKFLSHAGRLYTDHSGVLWIGTVGYGILRYNPKTERFGKQSKGIRNYLLDDVFQIPSDIQKIIQPFFISPRTIIEEPDSTLWISVDGKGIIKYSRSEKKIIKDYSPVCQPDYSLTDPVNVIGEKIAPYFGQIIKYTSKDKRETELWIGTEKGLLRMNTKTGMCSYLRIYPKFQTAKIQPNNTGNPDISAMLADANGVIWIGTPNAGLVRVDPENDSLRFFRHSAVNINSLSSDAILCIEQDPNDHNVLWIGTEGGGLNRFDTSTETFNRIHEGTGFPNNVVYGILADDAKKLWISTNKGLIRFNPSNGNFRTYDVNHGLQDSEFNRFEFFRGLNGVMVFGGINGCNAFNPRHLTINAVIPPVVITNLKLFNKSVSLKNNNSTMKMGITETKSLILNYSQNVITFEFAALEFSSPSNNNYAYKLEGFDDKWIYIGSERSATYTNLDPGEYIFRVKASNSDGIWNETGTSLMVTILPPYWMTWWFRLLSAVIIVVLIISGVVIIERRKAQERTRLAENEAALERERLRIARDMHDDLGARLTEISMIGDLAQRNGTDAETLKKNMQKITGAARETVSIFDEIVWAVNPRYDRLEHVANYFSQYATEYLASADIRCKLIIPEELPNIPVSAEARHNTLMVLKEVLNNVVKHAGASIVCIEIKLISAGVQFIIEDDGKGFNDGKWKMENGKWTEHTGVIPAYSEGLSGMKSRMESINGTVTIQSEPGKGTQVKLFLPLERKEV